MHYAVYAPTLETLTYIKQQLIKSENIDILNIPFHDDDQPFACLIHEKRNNTYFLIRDHFGFEPFYYTITDESPKQLCFGSTLPDILAHIKTPVLNTALVEETLMDICSSQMEYSDQTFYNSILRVTPGHIIELTLTPETNKQHHCFWTLTPNTPFIHYASDSDYDAHFDLLLQQAIQASCAVSPSSVGLEFSGGLDTAVILTALHRSNRPAELFMHIGDNQEERWYGDQLLQELNSINSIHYVNADEFEPITILDQYKAWFSGGAPYLFFMFAANIHQAVQKQGCGVLLSGFGGDECVSSHAPLRTYGAEMGYKQVWQELNINQHDNSFIRRLYQTLRLKNPSLHYAIQRMKRGKSPLAHRQLNVHYKPYYSLQEREADWLTGRLSHHVRMRIEYSAVLARYCGFHYRYPLLYPPLVEFCFKLPPKQKRRLGQNRLLMRRYLATHLPSGLFNTHKKCGDILPGTLPKCQKRYETGQLNHVLHDLPYQAIYDYIIKHQLVPKERRFHVDLLRYMFNRI